MLNRGQVTCHAGDKYQRFQTRNSYQRGERERHQTEDTSEMREVYNRKQISKRGDYKQVTEIKRMNIEIRLL